MAYEDLPLHRPDPPDPPAATPRVSSPTRWVVIGAAAVIAGALLTLWWMSRVQPAAAVPAPTTATEVALGSKRPKAQSEPPPIADSDTFLSQLVATLSNNPTLARLFATKGIVRGLTLAVVQIGDGKTPASPLAILRPASRLRIAGSPSGRVEPVTYIRWDSAVGALVSVSPADTAQAYVDVKRLFDEAYRDLGHPEGDFDEAIVRAIRTLDATPNIAGDPTLVERSSYFEHEDPSLRSLQPVQKQLLLIGPAHRQRLMAWLKQVAAILELKID